MENFVYAGLMFFSILVPVLLSFEDKIRFYKKFGPLLAGIGIAAIVFISWDVWFTARGIWHFNPDYTFDLRILHLPAEEWSFFFVIPYACIFIYEVLRYYLKKPVYPAFSFTLTAVLFVGLVVLAILHHDKLYTLVNFSFAALMLALQLILRTHKTYMTSFYIGYAVSIFPFLIVNGVLTALPVVIYNNTENLSLRAFTIPAEDFIYLLGLLLLVNTVYELLLQRRQNSMS